ncbi:hypothetical protein KSS87_005097 [Heliosperma pusillum]|nr:hypothetical protein KSS87_005097 [Heliosperma pusillum]
MVSVNGFRDEFSWDNLNEITDNFGDKNLVGETDYFQIFNGKIPPTSEKGVEIQVTVKVWKDSLTFADKCRRIEDERTFMAQPEAIKCSNIVNVVGYCCDGDHVAAVYELMSVSFLENYLVQDKLVWRDRMIVALGIARLFHSLECSEYIDLIHSALLPCVILDQEMNPVLCDIGVLVGQAIQVIERPKSSLISNLPHSSSEDLWTKPAGIFSFCILLLRLLCKDDSYPFVKARYPSVTLPVLSGSAWPTYKKLQGHRFFYSCDYDEVSEIAFRFFISMKNEITLCRVIQILEGLLIFILPARKSWGKVVTRGCTLMYFSYENLSELTNGFHKENLFALTQLGEAYRGKIQQDWNGMEAQDVIVKMWGKVNYVSCGREVMKSSMKDNIYRLRDEVFLLTQQRIIDHPNSVKLLGYCFDDKRMGAVYSHTPLGTLQNLLDDDILSWRDRVEIALELARFLELLHGQEPVCVVRNICAVHIIIDQGQFLPKKKASQKLLGFTGYRDPLFLFTGSAVPQSDIYAFGVLLMSLVCKCDMSATIQNFLFASEEEEYKSKYSVAHESFVNQPSFDQHDGHRLSQLAMQCLRLDYPLSRPTASDILEQILSLALFTGTHVSANVDVEAKVPSSNINKKKPFPMKYTHILKRLTPCISGKQKERKGTDKQRKGPGIGRPNVVKTRFSINESRITYIDEETIRIVKSMAREES